MTTELQLGDMTVSVVYKNIKNVHLSVHPPAGRVTVSAPLRMDPDTLRAYVLTQLGWIRRQQRKIIAQDRETEREYLDRESHYVWGERYLLDVVEAEAKPSVELRHHTLELHVRPGTEVEQRRAILDAWYRSKVRATSVPVLAQWETCLGVKVEQLYIQHMKTRWGACKTETGAIRLNTELAKKPKVCLEYIVLHEVAHLVEDTHGPRFLAILDQHMPDWRFRRDELNRLPLRHEDWTY